MMKNINDIDLPAVGGDLSNWTAAMACFRDVKPGETRKGLCKKVYRGLSSRRWHQMSEHVQTLIMSLAGEPAKSSS